VADPEVRNRGRVGSGVDLGIGEGLGVGSIFGNFKEK